MTLLLVATLELDMANITVCSGDFYQGLLGCNLLCRHNEVLSEATITLPRLHQLAAISWPQKKVDCIAIACTELEEPVIAMMTGSHILPSPPKPTRLQIRSTTFKAEGAPNS